ncbi:hypothetical protein L218DRAFT_954257 [Marasmius fiardii PR-910]|nr:hypothetical protein L218DRAFT_954257 [Marasmius fiardii PR-910]
MCVPIGVEEQKRIVRIMDSRRRSPEPTVQRSEVRQHRVEFKKRHEQAAGAYGRNLFRVKFY